MGRNARPTRRLPHTTSLNLATPSMSKISQKITPFLWFDNQAEEAAQFYTSIFKNSKIESVSRYGEAGQEIHGKPTGTAMTVSFQLEGMEFTALNGGPLFTFTEAVPL